MQPENSRAPIGPEQAPVETPNVAPNIGGGEFVAPTPEAGIETGAERKEQAAEASAAVADAASAATPLQPVIPVAVSTTIAPVTDDSPAVAGDEDVIEKEWVDKAKKIMEETKDDPHGRTERVNALQKDYLKKRYGKELGASQ